MQAALYGPFPARDAIGCTGTPVWTGTIDVSADGDYHTTPFTAAKPGYYTYYESIAATDLVRAVKTPVRRRRRDRDRHRDPGPAHRRQQPADDGRAGR